MARFNCVIADEVNDYHCNQEILCVRYVHVDMLTEGVPCIKAFLYLERATGHDVATAILSLLAKHGRDASHIRGQSYDGKHQRIYPRCFCSRIKSSKTESLV